ncbi:hypothetical protein CONPUDRAFT_159523 [Coniophora puteana RWD-64-598 SS2]|uniref:DUF6534 domain-containing protein n=1 Tax=Coniophora puteana (strain RWD-64-598) TaxID=741705 RepID=A0A5M3M7H7_CONPW|nr:uncharacterized protein CONPUDRAFT_159523 [Coniophora puteana RWD-64-598 SS2]EIW74740.1 hypothetical protein CONPUDRAFT_159523 [Coniophora puteana RWD-64-598 SS2]
MAAEYPPGIYHALSTYTFGYQLNWWLFGILTVQVYLYHTAKFRDRFFIQFLVYGSFLLETAQTAITSRDSYYQLVLSYGDPDMLTEAYLTWLTMPVTVGIISMIAQIFYAYRIYILCHIRLLAVFIVVLALTQGVTAIVAGVIVVTANSSDVASNTTNDVVPVTIWLTISAACDVTIFSAMTWILSTRRSSVTSANSNMMINRIIVLTVETGLASAACAICVLILFVSFKQDIYYALPAVMLSKIYSNSLLVLLNNRRNSIDHETVITDSSGTHHRSAASRSSGAVRSTSVPLGNVSVVEVSF